MTQIEVSLIKLGLEPSAAEIYLLLINNGELSVSDILRKTNLSRTTVHDVLVLLVFKEFVEYRKQGRHAYYKPAHPSKLNDLIQENKRVFEKNQTEFDEILQNITGAYNITSNKPGIKFYEGENQFEEVFMENLKATETIYSYVNRDAVTTQHKKSLDKYVSEIIKRNIKEKLICADTPDARALKARLSEDKQTQVKLLPAEKMPFSSGMDIYNNKIAYSTYKGEKSITVIIEDPEIYRIHRQTFEVLWNLLPE